MFVFKIKIEIIENDLIMNILMMISKIVLFLFFCVLVLSVLVLSVDRFLVVYFYFRYKEIVIYERVVVGVILIFGC